VPVTISMLRMVRQVFGVLDGTPVDSIKYSMNGKLSGVSMFDTRRFAATGEFAMPKEAPPEPQ
jgi:hypothetical protein